MPLVRTQFSSGGPQSPITNVPKWDCGCDLAHGQARLRAGCNLAGCQRVIMRIPSCVLKQHCNQVKGFLSNPLMYMVTNMCMVIVMVIVVVVVVVMGDGDGDVM